MPYLASVPVMEVELPVVEGGAWAWGAAVSLSLSLSFSFQIEQTASVALPCISREHSLPSTRVWMVWWCGSCSNHSAQASVLSSLRKNHWEKQRFQFGFVLVLHRRAKILPLLFLLNVVIKIISQKPVASSLFGFGIFSGSDGAWLGTKEFCPHNNNNCNNHHG